MPPSAIFALISSLIVVGWACWGLQQALPGRSRGIGLAAILWITLPSAAAAGGLLENFSATPPRMFFLLGAVLIASLAFAFSRWGAAVAQCFSLGALIGFHAFRVLPETLLLIAHREGLAPVQMTLEGRNLDILSALLALVIYLIWRRAPEGVPRWAAISWSAIALGLLVNIVGIAVMSMPTPLRQFHNEPANTFVASFPYVLLPAIHVTAALAGQLLLLRKLGGRLR